VLVSVIVIAALGIAAPEAEVTLPDNVPEVCPQILIMEARSRARIPNLEILCFIWFTPKNLPCWKSISRTWAGQSGGVIIGTAFSRKWAGDYAANYK
jgi:hypothetical protein